MVDSRCGRRAVWWWLLVAVLVLGACGIKTPPTPARLLLPDMVEAPSYVFLEDGLLVVTFRPPTDNAQGLPLRDLGGFWVDRSENLLDADFCSGCPVTYTTRFDIAAMPPPARLAVAEVPYSFEDQLKPGHVYNYRIFAHDTAGRYDKERFQTLVVYYDSPGQPPEAIRTSTEDRVVFLTWAPAERLIDGRPVTDVVGYDLYRRQKDGIWTRLNGNRPVPGNSYQDTQVDNQENYEYKLRTIRDWKGTIIAGPPSEVVSVVPVDLTPPPPPAKVYAASVKEGVKLVWQEVRSPDLAGYRVYRRRVDQPQFKKIGPDLAKESIFVDVTARQGEEYYYRVTSVDDSPAANESGPTPETWIRFEP
jgi:hypothetical protein